MQGSGHSDVGSALGSRVGKRGEATSKLLNPQQREAQLKQAQMEQIRKKKIAHARRLKEKGLIGNTGEKDADFAKLFGQDIDQFLENSDWDIDSDHMSIGSRGSKATIQSMAQSNKLKGMERAYLARLEAGQQSAGLKGNAAGLPNKK